MVELEFHNFDVYYLPLAVKKRNTGGEILKKKKFFQVVI